MVGMVTGQNSRKPGRCFAVKLFGAVVTAAGGLVLVSLLAIPFGFNCYARHVDSAEEFLLFALPVLWTYVFTLACLALFFRRRARHPIQSGLLVGLLVGPGVYVAFAGLSLVRNFWLIAHDGTAYWGLISVPSFWIGIPATIIGIAAGLAGGWAVSKCRSLRPPR